jgi:hypothetical protein
VTFYPVMLRIHGAIPLVLLIHMSLSCSVLLGKGATLPLSFGLAGFCLLAPYIKLVT